MVSLTVYDGANGIGGNKIYLEEKENGVFLDFGKNFGKYGSFYEEFLKSRDTRGIHDLMYPRVPEITRSQYSIQAIDVLFSSPIISSSDFAIKSKIPSRTAQRIVQRLKREGILRLLREGTGSCSPVYLFPELLDITEREDTRKDIR